MKSSFSGALIPALVLLSCGFIASARAQAPTIPPQDLRSNGKLVRAVHAPALLGNQIASVAASVNRTVPQFQAMVNRDHDLWMDGQGRLLYYCQTLQVQNAGGGSLGPPSSAPPFPLSQTFKLHSRASSGKKIYLDFDGNVTSGTGWNNAIGGADIVSTPFDQDGNPASFSASEQEAIQRVWLRMAEDYAPFEIDVTTEDPGVEGLRRTSVADPNYGTRVVISPDDAWFGGGAGGVAFLGVFDNLNSGNDVPCFVFTLGVANFEAYIAEAGSHEAGHTLGLNHDGKSGGVEYWDGGSSLWAPIMGVGYDRQWTQFSKGEYSGANNTEDDYVVMQSNGVVLRTDDHSNSTTGATVMPGPNPKVSGVIERAGDKDVFRFATQAGNNTLNVVAQQLGPDCDLQLELLDGNGGVLQTSTPHGSSVTINRTNVPAGTYFLSVSGVGQGDPVGTGYSTYGSRGYYTLQANVIGGIGITVLSPNGNENLSVGNAVSINWASTGVASNVKLEYSIDGGNNWSPINNSTANDGTEQWVVPNAPTTQGRIRVSSIDGIVTDTSNADFTITAAQGDAYEPDDDATLASTILPGESQNHSIHVPGDEDWIAFDLDERSNVTLTTDGPDGDTVLELYADDGTTLLATDDDSGAGSFSELALTGAAGLAPGTYYARVKAKGAADTIDAYTLSLATTPGASLRLLSPNGGEDWLRGSAHTITWDSHAFSGNVKLEWYDGDQDKWWVINASTPNDGFELWTVPSLTSSAARVRVTGVTDPLATDESDGDFEISAPPTPYIEVIYPNGGESLERGSTETVEWYSENVDGTVRLQFSTDGGKKWTTFAITNANDGSKSWNVPDVITQQALFRVQAVNGSAQDVSDDFFALPGPDADQYEVDDTAAAAGSIALGETQFRSIHLPNNTDWVKFTVTRRKKVVITTAGDPGGDTILRLFAANGTTQLATNDNASASNLYSTITKQLKPGTYLIKVNGRANTVIESYTLTVK